MCITNCSLKAWIRMFFKALAMDLDVLAKLLNIEASSIKHTAKPGGESSSSKGMFTKHAVKCCSDIKEENSIGHLGLSDQVAVGTQ